MSGELTVAVAAIVVAAPPSYWAMWRQIRKDRAEAAAALQKRLDDAERRGREAAVKDQRLLEMGQRLQRLEGGERDPLDG